MCNYLTSGKSSLFLESAKKKKREWGREELYWYFSASYSVTCESYIGTFLVEAKSTTRLSLIEYMSMFEYIPIVVSNEWCCTSICTSTYLLNVIYFCYPFLF